MAALLLRITYMIFPQMDWGFVFVDDFCWLLRSGTANIWATTILATYTALGVPLRWKKTVLSEINTWLGFVINPRTLVVRMATEKHDIGDYSMPPIQAILGTLLGMEDCMQNL